MPNTEKRKAVKSTRIKSIREMENPHQHLSVQERLRRAGAVELDGRFETIDHGNGYSTIVHLDANGDPLDLPEPR